MAVGSEVVGEVVRGPGPGRTAGVAVIGPLKELNGSTTGRPVEPGMSIGDGDGVDPEDGNKPDNPAARLAAEEGAGADAGAGAGADTTGWPPNTKPDVLDAGAGTGAGAFNDKPPNISKPPVEAEAAGAGAGEGVVANPENKSKPGDADGVVPTEAGTDRPLNMEEESAGAEGAAGAEAPPILSKSDDTPPDTPPPVPSKSTPSADNACNHNHTHKPDSKSEQVNSRKTRKVTQKWNYTTSDSKRHTFRAAVRTPSEDDAFSATSSTSSQLLAKCFARGPT